MVEDIKVLPWTYGYNTKEEMETDFIYDAYYTILNLILYNGDFYKEKLKEYNGVEEFIKSDMWKDIWSNLLKKFCEDDYCFEYNNSFIPLDHNDPVVIEIWNKIRDDISRSVFKNFYENIKDVE